MQRLLGLWYALVSSAMALSVMVPNATASAEPIWIDVRSAEEYASGHLPEAKHIPLQEIAVRIRDITTDPNAELKLYCGIGVRAQIAKLQLENVGYRNVTNEGGYADLVARRQARTRGVECNNSPSSEQQEGPC